MFFYKVSEIAICVCKHTLMTGSSKVIKLQSEPRVGVALLKHELCFATSHQSMNAFQKKT